MDATAKPEKNLEDGVKILKIDSSLKSNRINMSGPKDASPSDVTSCISSADATGSIKYSELEKESSMSDQGIYYYGYYYPGYNGLVGEWDTQSYASGSEVMETQPPGIQADNGSVVYYLPGFQAGYTPYNSFVPGAMINADNQYFSQQLYYSSQLSPQSVVSPGIFPQPIAYGPEMFPLFSWDPSAFFVDGLHGSAYNADLASKHSKSSISSHARNATYSNAFHTSRAASEVKGSSPVTFEAQTASSPNQPQKSGNKLGSTLLSKTYAPTNKFHLANQGNSGFLYPSSTGNVKESSQSWNGNEKLKARSKINGLDDLDLLNEQNRGPRTNGTKSTHEVEVKPDELPIVDKNDNDSGLIATVSKDKYNHSDFQTKYEHALFFVIKSYSEDDIHKSIKYNVWSSTPNGNKRLDNAFLTAQEKMMEKGSKCPVFLFFSVNASGQFCGVAEMTGRVDFSRNMDFWQQDKWNGFFPVKWHIIKDITNPHFRHIILENNDNKPVTNSRDTQEVKFHQGTEMLNIFKSYAFKTSILDDFDFYESRQRAMQDKKNKPHIPNMVHSLARNNELSQARKTSDSNPKVSDTASPENFPENPEDEIETLSSARE